MSPLGFFGERPPAELRAQVRGRVLAACRTDDGAWLLGTRDALHVAPAGGGPLVRFGWEEVHRADWDAETSTLRWERAQDFGRPVEEHTAVLPEPGTLLPLLRERVGASIVVQRRVLIERRTGLTVIGRRSPAGDGPVVWAFELDAGLDPDDPRVGAAAEQGLREAQESVGL